MKKDFPRFISMFSSSFSTGFISLVSGSFVIGAVVYLQDLYLPTHSQFDKATNWISCLAALLINNMTGLIWILGNSQLRLFAGTLVKKCVTKLGCVTFE